MRQLLRRAWYTIRQRQFEADLAEEMEFHAAMKQRDIEDRGVDPTEATFAVRRALGSIALAQDQSRTCGVLDGSKASDRMCALRSGRSWRRRS